MKRHPWAVALSALLLAGCQAPASGPSAAPTVVSAAPVASPSSAASVASPSSAPTAVKASELRRLTVPALGFDQSVSPVPTTAMGNAIDPPRYTPGKPSGPVRVSDKGVQPASDAPDTVYVGCHTSAVNGPDKYPCDVLIRTVSPGMRVVATTDAGVLIYTVTQTRSIPYGDFASDDQTWRVEPKRLVFVVCDVLDGKPTHANYVVYASLV